MIPDFKTYIGESVWGDIRKRGNGTDVKREDDVNLLDRDGLVEYLRKNYKCKDRLTIIPTIANGGCINICLYEDEEGYNVFLIYDNISGDSILEISSSFKENAEWIYKDMVDHYTLTSREEYDVDGHPLSTTKVEPNGCRYITIDNKFFLNVLDFIIDRVHEPLTKDIDKL